MLFVLALFVTPAWADAEGDINALIVKVQQLRDARFIRNGTEYSPDNAAQFMRRKWQAQCAAVKSVDEFIDTCMSKSSTTGAPYRIKQGEKTRPAAEVLRELAGSNATRG